MPETYLEKESQLLKCAQCENIWRYHSPRFTNKELPLPLPQPSPSPEVFLSPSPFSSVRPLHHPENIRRTASRYYLDWFFLSAGIIIGGIILLRETETIPHLSWFSGQMGHLYNSIQHGILPNSAAYEDNISLNVLTSELSLVNNKPIFKIKGEITNHSKNVCKTPPISVKLMDKGSENELELRQTWRYKPEKSQLNPGEKLIFETFGPAVKDSLPIKVLLTFDSEEQAKS